MDRDTQLIWEAYFQESAAPGDKGRTGRRSKAHLSQTDPQSRMSFSFTDDTSIRWEYLKELQWMRGGLKYIAGESGGRGYTQMTAFMKAAIVNVLDNYNEFISFVTPDVISQLNQNPAFSKDVEHHNQITLPDLKIEVLAIADKLGLPRNTAIILELIAQFAFSDINVEEYANLPDDNPQKSLYGNESRLSKTMQRMIGAEPGTLQYHIFNPVSNKTEPEKPKGPTIILPDNE